MKRFHTFAFAALAALGLVSGCEKRAPNADTQGKDYTASRDPNAAPAAPAPSPTATAPADTMPSTAPGTATDLNKQPVSGHDMAATPSDTAAATEIYWVSDDGQRTVISDSTLVTRIQQKLTEAGVYSGPTDGRVSADLSPAIRQFQAKRGLAQTGTIDQRTADALDVKWDKMKVSGKQLGSDVKDSAKQTGTDLKEGAKDLGRDIKDETKKAGEEMKEGAKDVKDFVDDKTK